MGLRRDDWLTSVLGHPVFALDGGGEVPDAAERSLCYARVDVSDVGRVASLVRRGFSVVDVNVTFALGAEAARPLPVSVTVEEARDEHHAELLEIAATCFRYSRFHLDPRIPDEAANRVKREWVRSYVEARRGLQLLAALVDGRPAGFLAVLSDADARVVDLVGVRPELQGRGVGSSLVAAFVREHAGCCRELRAGTQMANLPSLRLYGKAGFSICRASYVLHLHTGA